MIIQKHPKFMERLARIYVDKYHELGLEGAKEWAKFLDADLRAALKPFIQKEASRRL